MGLQSFAFDAFGAASAVCFVQGCNVPLSLEIFAKFAKFSSMRFLDLSSWVPGGQFCLQSSPVIENLDRLLAWLGGMIFLSAKQFRSFKKHGYLGPVAQKFVPNLGLGTNAGASGQCKGQGLIQ